MPTQYADTFNRSAVIAPGSTEAGTGLSVGTWNYSGGGTASANGSTVNLGTVGGFLYLDTSYGDVDMAVQLFNYGTVAVRRNGNDLRGFRARLTSQTYSGGYYATYTQYQARYTNGFCENPDSYDTQCGNSSFPSSVYISCYGFNTVTNQSTGPFSGYKYLDKVQTAGTCQQYVSSSNTVYTVTWEALDASGTVTTLGSVGSSSQPTVRLLAQAGNVSCYVDGTLLGTTTDNDATRRTSGLHGIQGQAVANQFNLAVLNVAPNQPLTRAPLNRTVLDRTQPVVFQWQFSDADATDVQSRADLILTSPTGVGTTYTVNSPSQTLTVAGGLAAGQWSWQVRTADAQGVTGPYSDLQTFVTTDAPATPVWVSPASGGTIPTEQSTVQWSAPAQDAYQVQRTTDVDSPSSAQVLSDTGPVSSTAARTVALRFPNNNSAERIRVRVRSGGLWSAWAAVAVRVSYTPPAQPRVVASPVPESGALDVWVTQPVPGGTQPEAVYVDLYRSAAALPSTGVGTTTAEERVATGLLAGSTNILGAGGAPRAVTPAAGTGGNTPAPVVTTGTQVVVPAWLSTTLFQQSWPYATDYNWAVSGGVATRTVSSVGYWQLHTRTMNLSGGTATMNLGMVADAPTGFFAQFSVGAGESIRYFWEYDGYGLVARIDTYGYSLKSLYVAHYNPTDHAWLRLAIGLDGTVLWQFSADGNTWTTATGTETWPKLTKPWSAKAVDVGFMVGVYQAITPTDVVMKGVSFTGPNIADVSEFAPSPSTPLLTEDFSGGLNLNRFQVETQPASRTTAANVAADSNGLHLRIAGGQGSSIRWAGYKAEPPPVKRFGLYTFVVRYNATSGNSVPAVMLWPASDVATDGEVDVFQTDGALAVSRVHWYLKVPDYNHNIISEHPSFAMNLADPHTYVVDWQPNRLRMWVDGRMVFYTSDPDQIPQAVLDIRLQNRFPDGVTPTGTETADLNVVSISMARTADTELATTRAVVGLEVTAPTGDLEGWKLSQVQGFDTPAGLGQIAAVYGDDMRGYSGFVDTSGSGFYDPDRVLTVSQGALTYDLHTVTGKHLVASPIPFGYTGQLYGRWAVRLKASAPQNSGYKLAFLLWPTSNDWADGEVDWPEVDNLADTPRPAVKQLGNYEGNFQPTPKPHATTDLTAWHTAVTEWTPEGLRFYWDGDYVGEVTDPAYVPTKPMRFTLQVETDTGGVIPADATTAKVWVDWVAQWSYNPATAVVQQQTPVVGPGGSGTILWRDWTPASGVTYSYRAQTFGANGTSASS